MSSGRAASMANVAACAAVRWCSAGIAGLIALAGCNSSNRDTGDAPSSIATDAGSSDASAPSDAGLLDDGTPGIPDLQPVSSQMTRTMITSETFDATSCEVVEGCVGAAGTRTLLRFNTVTVNSGTADLALGAPPPDGQSNAIFQWSQCHMHHHVVDYALFELVGDSGTILSGRKQAFCLEDDEPIAPPGGPFTAYTCNNQGISRGYADVYGLGLDCQWLDITGVAAGAYTLRVTINPDRTLPESNYDNNVFTLGVTLPPPQS